jgi:hypothetical protein
MVPKGECIFLLGDNSDYGLASPWDLAIHCIHGVYAGGARHYTIRLASLPEDDERIAEYIDRLGEQRPGQNEESASEDEEAPKRRDIVITMLACRILVDGGDDHDSITSRLQLVPDDRWQPEPIPQGRTAFSFGGRWVPAQDVPKPLLEEELVAMVRVYHVDGGEEDSGTAVACEVGGFVCGDEDEHPFAQELVMVDTAIREARKMGYQRVGLQGLPDSLKSQVGGRLSQLEENSCA